MSTNFKTHNTLYTSKNSILPTLDTEQKTEQTRRSGTNTGRMSNIVQEKKNIQETNFIQLFIKKKYIQLISLSDKNTSCHIITGAAAPPLRLHHGIVRTKPHI